MSRHDFTPGVGRANTAVLPPKQLCCSEGCGTIALSPETPMTLLILALACSSPSVTIASANHPDAPLPGALAEVQEHQIQRPILSCYEEALAAEPGLAGSIRHEVLGSHGILKTKLTGPGPEALQTCALKPMSNQRLLRTLGDGDHTVGFDLTVTFSPG